jgi:methyltransferase (TIGR00027 family)
MESGTPSRTALGVAVRRASHQLYDGLPRVLDDPIAVPILGARYQSLLEDAQATVRESFSTSMRAWLVVRSRYAEDCLAQAVAAGTRQYCLLGAGLDTFAHRNPHPGLRVFEVDHPATQRWKRDLLAAGGLGHPASLEYCPVDFERDNLSEQLIGAGFDWERPAFFAWLGVTMYLAPAAFRATLDWIGGLAAGSAVVMDYALPRHALPPSEQATRDALAERVQAIGEPFQLFFTPEEMAGELKGFAKVRDTDAAELQQKYLEGRTDGLTLGGRSGRIVCASR